jgi:hypothetical protein
MKSKITCEIQKNTTHIHKLKPGYRITRAAFTQLVHRLIAGVGGRLLKTTALTGYCSNKSIFFGIEHTLFDVTTPYSVITHGIYI